MSNQPPPPDRIGPYEIDLLLGTGGMGEVYKAYDPRLDRWVAVKHIRPEYALKDGYRQRLEREARTIASLDHPSIVQIFDILRDDDGGEWIVMELVDGPTVYDMIDNGPLDVGTTLTIALDVIHGLARAHEQGVLHRDLKSENVMVSRSGVAKILDFGLSKRLQATGEASLSVEGKVIGTCRVMAPEQADGQELDGRADLFAFGVLLYELVTARSPFRASTPVASMLKAFGEPHASVLDYNEDVPEELADLIDWLLTKNRDLRPENAQVVAGKLAELAAEVADDPAELAARIRMASRSWHGSDAYRLPDAAERAPSHDPLDDTVPGGPSTPTGSTRPSGSTGRAQAIISRAAASRAVEETMERSRLDLDGRRAHAHSESRWSSMFSTAFGLGLSPSRRFLAWTAWLMVFVTGWWGVASITRPMIPEEPKDARIVVLPFENHGPEEMAHFAAGLTDELIRELTGRRGLAVVSYRTAAQYGLGEKSFQQIGDELDIGYVIEGGVASEPGSGEDPRLRIALRLVRVGDGEVLLSQSIDSTSSDTLRVQREIADAVSAELGVQILADTRQDLSTDPIALDAYFRGLTLWHGRGYTAEVAQQAERYFQTAVEEDPSLVPAWAELSRVRSMIYFNGNKNPQQRRSAMEAIGRCRELAPDSISVLLASGYFEYQVLGNFAAARSAFTRALEMAPNRSEAQEAMGYVLRRQGLLQEAITYLQAAFDLDRANSVLAGFIGETARAQRRYGTAEQWFSIALRSGSDLPYVVGERAENVLALSGCGRLSEPSVCAAEAADRVLRDSNLMDRASLWGYRVRVGVFEVANGGRHEAFLALYDSVPENQVETNERLRLFWRKVMALQELDRFDEAEALATRYGEELTGIAANSEFGMHHALLGIALAIQSRREEAVQSLERAVELSAGDRFTGPRVGKWVAVAYVLLDEPMKAAAFLEDLSHQDYQLSLASYEIQADPIWQPLRDLGLLDRAWSQLKSRETNSPYAQPSIE